MFRRYDCTYCGEPCDSKDHVVPQSNSVTGKVSFGKSYTVPACRECNGTLGNSGMNEDFQFTVGSKSDYLIDHYEWKYRDFLDGTKGSHDDEDIEETTGTIKRILRADRSSRTRVLARLAWLQTVSTMDPGIDTVWDEIKQNEYENEES